MMDGAPSKPMTGYLGLRWTVMMIVNLFNCRAAVELGIEHWSSFRWHKKEMTAFRCDRLSKSWIHLKAAGTGIAASAIPLLALCMLWLCACMLVVLALCLLLLSKLASFAWLETKQARPKETVKVNQGLNELRNFLNLFQICVFPQGNF